MVGFGFRDVVISLILEEKGPYPALADAVKVMVTCFSAAESASAIKAARLLRQLNVQTELDVLCRKIKKQFSRSGKEGFSHVVLAAPDEVKDGNLSVKDLRTGAQEIVSEDMIVKQVRRTKTNGRTSVTMK
jgi:histidyl-tRNA synthetase